MSFPKTRRVSQSKFRRTLQVELLENRSLLAAEIFGTLYADNDRSGGKTGPDETLQGWRVFIDTNRNSLLDPGEKSGLSDENGDYAITGLAGGTYPVVLQLKPDWIPTTASQRNVSVQTDKTTRADFFVFAGGDLTGTVWSDLGNDGVRDADPSTGEFYDPGLAGWTIYLDLNGNSILDATEPKTTTDADGAYRFSDLNPDAYEVREILPAGWQSTRQHSDSYGVDILPLQVTVQDFGNYSDAFGTIQGVVFNDMNLDTIHNRNAATGDFIEPGLLGFRVFLDANANQLFEEGETFVFTDSDGEFVFSSVPIGNYDVVVELLDRWDPTPGTTIIDSVSVVGGDTTITKDFSLFTVLPGAIGGLIWNDTNRNGIRDFNTLTGTFIDPVLSGWTVFVDLNRNSVHDAGEPTTTTGVNGRYFFGNLQVGTYFVQEVLPTGWELAPTFTDVHSVVVNSGLTTNAPDFANVDATAFAPGSIAGDVWDDKNANGIREAGDAGLAGWNVYIDSNANGSFDTGEPQSITNSTGGYSFTSVSPGSVTIRVIPQAGWTPTAPTTNSRTITLRGSQNLTGVLFGQYQRQESGITGTVFADKNNNAVRDAGEPGLAGATVYLDLNNNAALDAGEPSLLTSSDLFYTPAVNEAGTYAFTHLAAGTYVVRMIVPDTLSATPADRLVHSVTLATAQRVDNVNTAAVYRSAQISGTKYVDSNRNLVRDAGEEPIIGATVYVDLDRDDVLDDAEPICITGSDGSYTFIEMQPGSYIVRSVPGTGYSRSSPNTVGGTIWPTGSSNPASGLVTPSSITATLATGASHRQNVSITLPDTGSLTNMVDVFLLFDDTGSFVSNSPIVRGAFPDIMTSLQTASPGTDFGFGVGRFEEYANFASEYATGRPFILNQPIVSSSTSGYVASIQAALNRTTPGYGGDGPETDIEALYQLVTGRGFDGNNNGSVLDSGPAGLASTQLNPGATGDVPSFASFVPDSANGVLPASGNIGGAGFRYGALPIVLLATDIGVAYQPKGETVIAGAGGVTLPISQLTQNSRATTPFNSGAGLQETITALNALGALVIGLGTNPVSNVDPRQQLEAISTLTGAINRSDATIANGTVDPIAPGDPLYFQIATGFASSVANGITQAIQNAVTNVAVDIDVRSSDPRVQIINHTGIIPAVGSGMTSTFDIEFIGDGRPHRFDLQFVRAGTSVVIGSIPVVIGTPVTGDNYHYDELEDGEYEIGDDFGDYHSSSTPNQAPSFVPGADVIVAEDAGSQTITPWATGISPGPESEAGQTVQFITTTSSPELFSTLPSITPTGTLSFTSAANAFGTAVVTVVLKDNGGTENGGVDSSTPHLLTITVNSVNDIPEVVTPIGNRNYGDSPSPDSISLAGRFQDVEDPALTYTTTSSNPDLVTASIDAGALVLQFAPAIRGTSNVQVTATDNEGASVSFTFEVTVGNAIPSLEVSGPLDGYQGVTLQSRNIRLTPSDATDNQGRNFTFEVDWGDGTALETYQSPASVDVAHVYTTTGTKPGRFRVMDPDGAYSPWVSRDFGILQAETQGTKLLVGGSVNADVLTLTPAATAPNVSLVLNGTSIGTFALGTNGVEFLGGLGNDQFRIQGTSGNDTFTADAGTVQWQSGAAWPTLLPLNGIGVESTAIEGLAGDDTLEIISGNIVFDGGLGTDRLAKSDGANLWSIQGANAGQLNGTNFTAVESLAGGTGDDVFEFLAAGSLTGSLAGGTGTDRVSYAAKTTAVQVNLATGTATHTGGILSIEDFVGSSATAADTFSGSNTDNVWNITARNTANINSGAVTLSQFESLIGGTLNDSFVIVGATADLTGSVQGGLGVDTIDYSSLAGPLSFSLVTNVFPKVASLATVERVVGSASSADQVTGANATNAWTIPGLNQANIGTWQFVGVENINGGTGVDTFTLTSATSGWTGTLKGNGGLDNLVSSNNATAWQLTGVDTGTINGSLFQTVENLKGGTAVDTFTFSATSRLTGSITGGTGVDVLDLSLISTAISIPNTATHAITGLLGGFTTVETVIGSNLPGNTLVGAAATTTWTITSTGAVSVSSVAYSGFGTIVAGTGADTLVGPNLAATWNVSGAEAGSITVASQTINFTEMENLTGGTGVDQFIFQEAGRIPGTLNGGTGVDVVDLSAIVVPYDVSLGTNIAVTGIIGKTLGNEQLVGNASVSNRVLGANAATAWAVNTTGQVVAGGITFSNIQTLVGGTLVDTITGPNVATDWQIQAPNAGTVAVAGRTVTFSGIENITGGTAVDTVTVQPTGTLSGNLNGGTGTARNSLSYRDWVTPVTVRMNVTTVGNATAITGSTTNFALIRGGQADDTLVGAASASTILLGMGGNDTLTGGTNRDILVGGLGSDLASGGAGDDIMIAGWTSHDDQDAAWVSILAEWTSTRNFATRTANILGPGTTRLNGTNYLNRAADTITDTVFSETGSLDNLLGQVGQDWFFSDNTSDFNGAGTTPDKAS